MSVLSSLMGTMQADSAGQAVGQAAQQASGAEQAATQAGQAVINIPKTAWQDPGTNTFWLPEAASVTTDNVDWIYLGLIGLSIFCFIGITAAVVYFTIKYRQRPGHERPLPSPSHNNPLEITWTLIPAIICVFLFVAGWRGYVDLATPPQHALEISVTGLKWKWKFTYPNGVDDPNGELHVPVNRSVRLVMSSNDVIHSFFIPAFRIKQDVVPQRYTQLWFKATQPGVYRMYCAEYCGLEHSQMKTVIVVHEPGGYADYLARIEEQALNIPPAELGKKMYDNYCIACHTLDGTTKVGPSFKDLVLGGQNEMTDGSSIVVDENYIRESIVEPQAKVRKGYPASMPSFKGVLSDKKINGVIAFIKSLNDGSQQ
ncbi:MAG: cytochrome c oxidase subunit II [Proteobacteria bacterium]|nr:cytochrome c oxidase subunit II [Pseudomonadota bacterium]